MPENLVGKLVSLEDKTISAAVARLQKLIENEGSLVDALNYATGQKTLAAVIQTNLGIQQAKSLQESMVDALKGNQYKKVQTTTLIQ